MSFLKSVSDSLKNVASQAMKMQPEITREKIEDALRVVVDPDLHKDIVSLGFLKDVKIEGHNISVEVELTTPACPVKELLKNQCEEALKALSPQGTIQVTMTARPMQSPLNAASANKNPSLASVSRILAVASGKGGVGKSTTAVNLAYALSANGARVGIMDADVYGPSVQLMTKVGEPTKMTADNFVVPPEVDGIKVISVAMFASAGKASILRGPMAAQIIKQFMTQIAWGELDYLIIDYPPGTGDIQLTISQLAPLSGAVIVTTPQEVALIDVRRAISMFETLKVPVLGVIETMSYFVCDGCEKKHHIFRSGGGRRVAGEYGLPILGEIPLEEAVATGGDDGAPIVKLKPESQTAKAYQSAAGSAASQLSILEANDQGALSSFSLTWRTM